jgi:hypothetical protein
MIIPERFNGPSGSGNGGYTCGLVAGLLGAGTAEVTLRMPPPLETELSVARDGATVRVYADTALVAEALAVEPVAAVVSPVPLAEAIEASRSYAGFLDHPFPACFVCGPRRPHDDGLRVFPGPLADGRTAAPFTAPGDVSPALVWAALDCPGGWAVIAPGRPYVLGRMSATVSALPRSGDECVVVGACEAVRGRKAWVATSLYGPAGDLLAAARATWIEVGVAVTPTG